jgi:hypothetical protein
MCGASPLRTEDLLLRRRKGGQPQLTATFFGPMQVMEQEEDLRG